jgi:hypothetical protein
MKIQYYTWVKYSIQDRMGYMKKKLYKEKEKKIMNYRHHKKDIVEKKKDIIKKKQLIYKIIHTLC